MAIHVHVLVCSRTCIHPLLCQVESYLVDYAELQYHTKSTTSNHVQSRYKECVALQLRYGVEPEGVDGINGHCMESAEWTSVSSSKCRRPVISSSLQLIQIPSILTQIRSVRHLLSASCPYHRPRGYRNESKSQGFSSFAWKITL